MIAVKNFLAGLSSFLVPLPPLFGISTWNPILNYSLLFIKKFPCLLFLGHATSLYLIYKKYVASTRKTWSRHEVKKARTLIFLGSSITLLVTFIIEVALQIYHVCAEGYEMTLQILQLLVDVIGCWQSLVFLLGFKIIRLVEPTFILFQIPLIFLATLIDLWINCIAESIIKVL